MELRTVGIWVTTISICTFGSAAIVAIPHWYDNSCMVPYPIGAIIGGVFFGFVGFLISLVLSPVAVKSDKFIREHWVKVKEQEKQGQNNALSLLRAAECPSTQQKAELLRPARSGNTTAPEQLLRAGEQLK